MSPDKQQALFDRYPDIFREKDLPMSQTCMCWGIETGDGWYKLLDELCARLTLLKRYTGVEVVASQVKSKFATLRFYHSVTPPIGATPEEARVWGDIVYALVNEAERVSEQTCENTGAYGELCIRGGWYATLCKEEAKEQGYLTMDEWWKQREAEAGTRVLTENDSDPDFVEPEQPKHAES